jgi:hypothetical protein
MSKADSNSHHRTKFRVEAVFGSISKAAALVYDLLPADGNPTPTCVGRLVFDFTERPPADLTPPQAYDQVTRSQFFVPAVRPIDSLSLQQAQEDGLIEEAAGQYRQSRPADDQEGAGGIPADGCNIARLNNKPIMDRVHRLIQKVLDYETRIAPITKGNNINNATSRIPVHIVTSAVGGTGSGALVWFVAECILPCAQANGVEAKVVPEILLLGNLQTHDTEKARINEFVLLKFLQACATGTFVDPVTGRLRKVPFDHVRLFSSTNNHGSIGSLRRLVYHQAHLSRFMWHTHAGSDLQEREPDIGDWGYGRFEDPLCGYTGSISGLHWDKPRLLDCCGYLAGSWLAESFLHEGDRQRVVQEATSLAVAANLVESQEQNQLTSALGRPEELAGETVYSRTDKALLDGTAGLRGRRKALRLAEEIASTCNNDIPSVYSPLMQGKARSILTAAEAMLKKHLDQLQRKPQGLSEAIMFLQCQGLAIDQSQRAVAAKLTEIQEHLAPHEQAIADAAEQMQKLQEQNRLRRAISFQLINAITRILEQSGRAAINYHLQMTACTIAIQAVLMPLRDFVERMLARLMSTHQTFSELAQHCRNVAKSKAEEPTDLLVPVGLELVNAPYVNAWFTEQVARSGGKEQFVANLRGLFLQKHESFAPLTELSLLEMEQAFVALCRSVFEPAAQNTNALAEFRRIYPDEKTQQSILTELIGQCEGRLLIEGEINASVAWVKTANVPSADDVEWMRKKLEDADRKSGKWQVAANPADIETFSMVQFRGKISLSPLIKRLNIPDDYDSWKRLIAIAADPDSAIMVPPNPTPRQFRRVLAKAIATGLLTIETNGCFVFRSATGEEWLLGKDVEAVYERLHPRYRQLVYIESYFASQLVDSEAQIAARLDAIKDQLHGNDQATDKLLRLIDAVAAEECLQQAQLLRPWAKRIHNLRKRMRL